MSLYLAHDVHVAKIDEDLVFLDVRADAYTCAPGAAAGWRSRPYGLEIDDADLVEMLLEAGILTQAKPPHVARPYPARPIADLMRGAPTTPTSADWWSLAAASLAMTTQFRGRPLGALVGRARRRGAPRDAALEPDDALLARSAAFARLLPWSPLQGACLFRAFMQLAFLGEQSREALWVFGVRTWPFEAHCWLQAGGVVLDDTVDNVTSYTPILAV